MSKEEYKKCLRHIGNYWKKITFYTPKNKGIHVGLPNKFVAPNLFAFKKDQFYWDSYFIILGLVESGKVKLAEGMIDNFVFLFNRFGIIPARNRSYNLGVSQPPFLTSMILEVFKTTKDKGWLKKTAKVAEQELKNYWMDDEKADRHLVYRGLSRYCDHFVGHIPAEHEAGWDLTSRFNEKCLNFLPVDLNSLLYKYEKDLAGIYHILKNKKKAQYYQEQATKRKKSIMKLMWDNKRGFFFDYNYKLKKKSRFYSLAGFYPLWAEIVSNKEALKIVKNIKKFEREGGLVNTQKTSSEEIKQWDYPNGWANQQWIVFKGLLNYGFKEDAERLATKWLDLNKKIFLRTGKFWEKYDVVHCKIGKSGRYPTQEGFGWTNSIFVKLISEIEKLK